MSYNFYQDLEQPAERMGFMEIYLLADCIGENEGVELSPELQELVEMAADEAH
jgi:hypothetical protein